ncbi:hypothetical protein ACPWRU_15420, partial (plasmid) [Lactiplantibacillus plantarum subsp. plantarum]
MLELKKVADWATHKQTHAGELQSNHLAVRLCNSVRAYQICIVMQVECFSNSLLRQRVSVKKGSFY